jgi:predicted nucleic acid-binding protein
MITYLLDTSVIIDVLNEKKRRRPLLRELVAQGHVLGCCPINIAEIYAGLRAHEEPKTGDFLRTLQYYPVTYAIAERGGLLKRDYGRKGKTLSITDALIAAVAIDYELTLITDNIKDFPMPDLAILTFPRA